MPVVKLSDVDTFKKKEHTCKVCCKKLTFKQFPYAKHINGNAYFQNVCSKCIYKRKKINHPNRIARYQKVQKDKETNTLQGRTNLLCYRSKQKAKRYGYSHSLSKEFVLDKLKIGKCEATGIQLYFGELNIHPYAPSLDRIDSNKGYTEDNVQLTCMMYNFCKNQFSTEQVNNFIRDAKLNEN